MLTRIVEAYDWANHNFELFGRPFLGDHASLRAVFAAACDRFLATAREQVPRSGLLVLKSPELLPVLDRFRELVPRARVVVMLRDPRDQVASEIEVAARRHRGWKLPVLWAYRRSGLLARRYATRLRDQFAVTGRITDTVNVRYEDLVRDFGSVKAALEAQLGVQIGFRPEEPWPDISDIEEFRAFASWSPKYGRPVDPASVGRYRADLRRHEVAAVERICGGVMHRFGYDRAGSKPSS